MGDIEVTVDEHDNLVGSKHWRDKNYDDIYRVSALWLTDKKTGDVLLAQRSWGKYNDPGLWGPAAAGTIEIDETYEQNMVKEIEEEIGLSNLRLSLGPKTFEDDGSKTRYFCQWFLATVDKDKVQIKLQKEEVEDVKWLSPQALVEEVRHHSEQYVPSMIARFDVLGVH